MSAVADKLRETWPPISAGPVTTAQRELANNAADLIDELYEALTTARMALIAIADSAVEAGFAQLGDIIDDQLAKANSALAKARGEQA